MTRLSQCQIFDFLSFMNTDIISVYDTMGSRKICKLPSGTKRQLFPVLSGNNDYQ